MNLYFKYFLKHVKSQMEYKFTFILNIFGRILMSLANIIGVIFMLKRVNKVQGFTLNQILLCSSIISMSFSIVETFACGFDIFPRLLGNGEFDRVLVRPRGIIFQILASNMDFMRLGTFIQAVIVFCYAIFNSDIMWTWNKILTLFMMVFCGTIVFFGLYIMQASIAFFTTESLELMNILTRGGQVFGRYPFSIYGKGILKFLTYVIPLALFQYYPFLYLIDKSQNIFCMFEPLLSLLFLIPCYLVFCLGLSYYKSTGS